LEVFPDAKFIHVHRHPLTVFSSMQKTLTINIAFHSLQRVPSAQELDDWIISQYRTLHDAFFEERDLIPPGHYYELTFESLEADPLGQMQHIYETLDLPDFSQVRADLERYVDNIRGYQRNEYSDLPAEMRRRLADAWRPSFEQWGYASDS
jgi:hypothetical protein